MSAAARRRPAALARRREALVAGRDPGARSSRCAPAPAAGRRARCRCVEALRAEVEARGADVEVEARHGLPRVLPGAARWSLLHPEGIVYQHVERRRRRRDRREDRARRRRRAAPLHRRRTERLHAREERDPVLPRPAAPAARRQRAARPHVDRRLHRARRLLGARQGARDGARGRPRRGQALRACAAAAAPASRPAASGRPAAGPRATSSTWSATPTRAIPARSWTTPSSRATRTACSRA